MITDNEKFIEIQAILASSNINTRDCAKINDLIIELSKENQELKSQLKGTTHCFDEEEHEKLNKQLEELKEEKQEWINLLAMFKNQQKEFIKWLKDYLNLFDNMCIDEQGYYDMLEEILQKYKEIIGGK